MPLPATIPRDKTDPLGLGEDLPGLQLHVAPSDAGAGFTPACLNWEGNALPRRALEIPSFLFSQVSQTTVTLVSSLDPNATPSDLSCDEFPPCER